MKIAFTFPGQGSQAVGMGQALAAAFPEARLVFEEVNEALGEDLSKLMFEGPLEQLTLTRNAQPALMAVSMALIRTLESQGLDLGAHVSYMAGHSLGEYSALCAAGCFDIATAARLLRARGEAMQAAVPEGQGGMAALIGLSKDEVFALCKQVLPSLCEIANDNGGGQFVVSGQHDAVLRVCEAAKLAGAKRALMLPVSAPFHCQLMQPAADIMAAVLREAPIASAKIPVISNVSVEPVTNPESIRSLLVAQVTGQVRWQETLAWLISQEVDHVFEVGSGKVLTGLAKRAAKEATALTISSPEELDQALKYILG